MSHWTPLKFYSPLVRFKVKRRIPQNHSQESLWSMQWRICGLFKSHITSSAETTSTATKKEFDIIKNKSSFLFCLLDLLLAAAWGRVKRDTNNLEPYNRDYIGWRAVNTCGGGGNNARDLQRNELRPQRPRIKTQHPVRGPLGGCCAWRTDWLRRFKTLRENKVEEEEKKIKLLL